MNLKVKLLDITGVENIIHADSMKEISDIANTEVALDTNIFDNMDEPEKADLITDAEALMKTFGMALVNALKYKQMSGDGVYMEALLREMVVNSRSSHEGALNVKAAGKI